MSLAITDGVAFIHVQGEVDLANADQLQALGQDAISDYVGTIRIDLSEVTFMDSTGLAALVAIRNSAEDANRFVILERPSDRVMKVLEVTSLADVFTIDTDQQTGVSQIKGRQARRTG